MKRPAAALAIALLAGAVGCTPALTCAFVQNNGAAPLKRPPLFATAIVSGNMRTVSVYVKNTGTTAIQLLPQEWSIGAPDGSTSAVAPTTTPNKDVASISLPPVTLPPSGTYQAALIPRARHHAKAQAFRDSPLYFVVDPLVPIVEDGMGMMKPRCEFVGLGRHDVSLTIVALIDGERVIETLAVPIEVIRTN